MPSLRTTLIAGAVVHAFGLGLFSASPSQAQTPPAAVATPAFHAPEAPPHPPCGEQQAVLAGQLAALEVRLALQPEQVATWQAFVRDVRAAVAPLQELCRARQAEDAGLPGALAAVAGDPIAVLEARQKPLDALQAAMTGLHEAAVRLNEVLVPAQRQAFARTLFLDGPGLPPPPGGPFGPPQAGPGGFEPPGFGPGPHGMHPPLPPH